MSTPYSYYPNVTPMLQAYPNIPGNAAMVPFADRDPSIMATTPEPDPLSPRAPWATATLLKSAGVFFATTALGWVLGKRTFNPQAFNKAATIGAKLPEAAAKKAVSHTTAQAEQHTITTYRNIDSPLLTMAFLSQRPELRGVLGWFGLASVMGYIGGQALQGLQEAWVRAEETAIRMRGMDRMVSHYQSSVRDRNETLQRLKQQTWQTIQQWLTQQGITQPEHYNPLLGISDDNAHQQWAWERHTNYLLEPRTRPNVNFSSNNPALFSPKIPPVSESPLSSFSVAQWLPVLSGLAGAATGLVARSLKKTVGQMNQLVARTTLSAGKNEAITGLFVKNTEALAVLAKQLEAPGLLLTYGLSVGLLRAGKLMVDGLREVAVTEENTQTELSYQQYMWGNLGTRLMAVAEGEWLKVQLSQLARDLPQLAPHPVALRQRIASVVQGIGLNSAPPHYNTPLSLNITAARS